MERVQIKTLHDHVGKEASIAGWVDARRDHGKLVFIELRDGGGRIQVVVTPEHPEAHGASEVLRSEWVLAVTGTVRKRPEKMVNKDEKNGDLEMEAARIDIVAKAEELPFEKDTELNLDTHLDHLPLTLRSKRSRDIFTVQAAIIQAFRESMRAQGFIEYQNPVLVGGDGEGGAAAFSVNYYGDKKALLATSPQLYKQIMVGVFERVYTTAKVFRAEKHATTRHLSEVVQMDFEMGFIENHRDVMRVLERAMRGVAAAVSNEYAPILERFGVPAPLTPESFPVLMLGEAQNILEKEFGIACAGEPDLDPEQERTLSEWARQKHLSDFLFITHFPNEKRPFYTYHDPDRPGFSRSFDLLFRGVEINSGSQRVHDYQELVRRIEERGLDPNVFSFYLEAFRSGMPPHGGCSTGLERLTAKMLGLKNVKEATLFPRDIHRIDRLLSENI